MTVQTQPAQEHDRDPGFLQVLQSVAWSFFGVQSSRNRQRDFTRGKPWHYIAMAVAMTGVVVMIFIAAVQLVLAMAVS